MEDKEIVPAKPSKAKVKSTPDIEQKAKAAVNKFIDQHLRNSNFSLDTPAWNHFQAGLPVLIGCIVSEMED